MLDVVIIGAGPYGLSLAAHAVANGLSYRLLGYPMDFWKNQMPQNMFIRTPHEYVNFSDPDGTFTLKRFSEETGTEIMTPLPRTIFVDYAMWFAEKTGIEFTPQLVVDLQKVDDTFLVRTEAGEQFSARHVIIATGVEHFKHIPEIFRSLPTEFVSHTSGYLDFRMFSGKKVAVIGSGQSAWEAAGLLHMEGAEAELLYRRCCANYGGSRVGERYLRMLGNAFYKMPLVVKRTHWGQSPGSVAHFLRPYVEGKVPETGNVAIHHVEPLANGQVKIELSNGEARAVDHVLIATGFRINLDRLPFVHEELRERIVREEEEKQFPLLDEHFESSVAGLFFAGPLSSHSHGPTFRFILGLKKTATTIASHIGVRVKVASG